MILRNKKSGDIIDAYTLGAEKSVWEKQGKHFKLTTDKACWNYNSLAELNEEWEDYREPQVAYYIDRDGKIVSYKRRANYPARVFDKEENEAIGNYFETREEAEKVVEKLKAWKRLKDAGCKIVGWEYSDNVDLNGCKFNDDDFIIGLSAGDINEEDLDLLFGGEE